MAALLLLGLHLYSSAHEVSDMLLAVSLVVRFRRPEMISSANPPQTFLLWTGQVFGRPHRCFSGINGK